MFPANGGRVEDDLALGIAAKGDAVADELCLRALIPALDEFQQCHGTPRQRWS